MPKSYCSSGRTTNTWQSESEKKYKDGNKANQTPDEGIHWENVDLFTDAVVSEVDETFDAEHQYQNH